jgi:thymidylate synthase
MSPTFFTQTTFRRKSAPFAVEEFVVCKSCKHPYRKNVNQHAKLFGTSKQGTFPGEERPDRTGAGTIGLFGVQLRFDISKKFPLLTTKKVHLKSVIYELLWFLKGSTNVKYLRENGVKIGDEWADESGELGSIYGS